jgi:hypothetical protein
MKRIKLPTQIGQINQDLADCKNKTGEFFKKQKLIVFMSLIVLVVLIEIVS